MSKDNFILYDIFNQPLSAQMFRHAKKEYIKTFEGYRFEDLSGNTIIELIDKIKRTPGHVGPYKNMSVFEAFNRIGTDLVLLAGAEKLFKRKNTIKTIELRMGVTKGFDFIIKNINGETIIGEAFNAAPSFCKYKMRQAYHKILDNPKEGISGMIMGNADVEHCFGLRINKRYENLKNDYFIERLFVNIHSLWPTK